MLDYLRIYSVKIYAVLQERAVRTILYDKLSGTMRKPILVVSLA